MIENLAPAIVKHTFYAETSCKGEVARCLPPLVGLQSHLLCAPEHHLDPDTLSGIFAAKKSLNNVFDIIVHVITTQG